MDWWNPVNTRIHTSREKLPNCARIYFDTGVNGGMNVGSRPEKSNSAKFFHSRGQWLIRRHRARETRVYTSIKKIVRVYTYICMIKLFLNFEYKFHWCYWKKVCQTSDTLFFPRKKSFLCKKITSYDVIFRNYRNMLFLRDHKIDEIII